MESVWYLSLADMHKKRICLHFYERVITDTYTEQE